MRVNTSLGRLFKQPEIVEWLRRESVQSAYTAPEEFSVRPGREVAKRTRVVQSGNINPN